MSHEYIIKQISLTYVCKSCGKEMSGTTLSIASIVPFVLKNHVYVKDCACKGRFTPSKIRMDIVPKDCIFYQSPVGVETVKTDTKTNYYRFVVRCAKCGAQYAKYKMLDRPMSALPDAEFERLMEAFVCDNAICKLRNKDPKMELVSCVKEYPTYD